MSKDDSCKVSSASKHKERKPKKPHYIPRPWGKPYNYKCFQCPFTCMEKSHLYNHMKYSLCKNSLSLLIESDWPYKKGNVLHPDQLRSFQQGLRNGSKGGGEGGEGEERERQRRAIEEEDAEEAEEEEEERERNDGRDVTGVTKETSVDTKAEAVSELRKPKQADSDLLMADVLSLEEQLLRARSADVEAQLKHYKLSKSCLTTPGLLSEHWRLLTQNNHTKTKTEPRVSSSIPCYPPPPGLVDYPDPAAAGLNLSVLGVGYPISPGLFSYMNSTIPTAASSMVAQNQIAQQLPFLASMHPASGAPSPIPPRLYYPFLCEHTFGQTEPGKTLKTTANNLESNALSSFQPKVSLWKVPAVRPGAVQATNWGSSQRESPEQSFKGEKPQIQAKEGKAVWGVKRTGAPVVDAPAEKKQSVGFTLDLLKNFQTASSLNLVADKLLLQNNLADAPPQTQPLDSWYKDALSPNSESSSVSNRGGANALDSAHSASSEGSSESVAALLTDLSKALRDYQEAERRISHMEAEDVPAQRDLWEHLSKIRSELSHIHQALEQTSRPSDGPLDLSVKKDSDPPRDDFESYKNYKDSNATETDEEEDDETEAKTASLESRKQSLDLLIKMSQTAVVNPDVLGASEALWPSRTTKCEADSSVLLCPDGRSVVFTEISGKTQKRPSSLQRFENQCPHSPMTAAEN